MTGIKLFDCLNKSGHTVVFASCLYLSFKKCHVMVHQQNDCTTLFKVKCVQVITLSKKYFNNTQFVK